MNMEKLRLAQLLCSRICHDLITPVGAVTNGLEFLETNTGNLDPELLHLIQKSSQNAAQRLMLFRAACSFGGHNLLSTFEKTAQVLAAYLGALKINFIWANVAADMSKVNLQEQPLWGRVFVNLAAILAESAPKGGELNLSFSVVKDQLTVVWEVRGNLTEMKHDNILALTGQLPETDVTPLSIQSYLTFLFLEEMSLRLQLIENASHTIQANLMYAGYQEQASGMLF